MFAKTLRVVAAGAIAASLATSSAPSDVTVHEWGTFTSVAGADGSGVAWVPLKASKDLPPFIEHFRDTNFKCSLSGSVRMETPVLYFYSPRETTVSVKASFAKGTITEWYPHATAVSQNESYGAISWHNVRLMPGAQTPFPSANSENHYYAARDTAATPVRVKAPGGDQDEKFLFYRGVSSAPMPIAAGLTPEGNLQLQNAGGDEIPAVMLIESRGGKVGYRMVGSLREQSLVDPPALTSSTDSMLKDLEGILVGNGLYADEARAMIATWRNSWFEEGSRLLYILPAQAVNAILPLTVSPAPMSTVRVFVGRLELITPATEQAVELAFQAHDQAAIDKYRRFLAPILNTMIAKSQPDTPRARELRAYLQTVYSYACR
jgi:hypothetical protein